jgi:hypothetical protein
VTGAAGSVTGASGSGDGQRKEAVAMGLLIQLAFIACMIGLLVFLVQQYRRMNKRD